MISLPVVLFLLRLLSALLLLTFLGGMAWLVYTDMALTADLLKKQNQPVGQLHIIASDNPHLSVGTILPLYTLTRIGRAASSHLVIDEQYVSAQHALIMQQGSQLWLTDLHSSNGTRLNDLLLSDGETAVISHGDLIGIGSIQLRLVL